MGVYDKFNQRDFSNRIAVWRNVSEAFNMKSGELVAALKMFPGKYSLTHWDFKHSLTHWDFVVFSSPEPKAQVRFSDHNLSVV